MSSLLNDVLRGWQGPLPRLEYVTDGGHHPSEYFDQVLRAMVHPCTGGTLAWQQVLDFYHACGYITKMAEALFGAGTRQASSWAHKMSHWLPSFTIAASVPLRTWSPNVRCTAENVDSTVLRWW